jgi:acetoin utilization protein AcuB
MTTDVISVNPETELEEVVDLMIEHKIGAVPVVEADSSKLVGIVSYIDALRAARDLF